MSIKIDQKAPNFTLLSDENKEISLTDFHGKKVILYFYPKDNTPGCTLEAKEFRDSLETITAKNAVVLGISKDSVKTHDKFKCKHTLNFPLLSDPNGEVCDLYGVWKEKSMFGKTALGIERTTFLIDENGIVKNIWRKVKVKGHIDEVMAEI